MYKYNEVLQGLDELNIKYHIVERALGQHALLATNSKYLIKIIDFSNTVLVYVCYEESKEEVIHFQKEYGQASSAIKKVVALYEELKN